MADDDAQSGNSNTTPGAPDLTSILTGAVALFVAVLAAVGLTGDVLTRAFRNLPFLLSALFVTLLLSMLGIFSVYVGRSRRSSARSSVVSKRYFVLVAITVSTTVFAGAVSVADREQPAIALQAAYAAGQVTLTVESNATGLSTSDQLTVQVLGLSVFDVIDKELVQVCEQIYAYSVRDGSGDNLKAVLDTRPEFRGSVSILLSERLGPDASGSIESVSKLDFPAGLYQGVCAFSPLPSDQLESSRSSASYLRLSNCNETSTKGSSAPDSLPGTSSPSDPPSPVTVTVTTTASPSWAWNQTSNCSPALNGTSHPTTTTTATP